ncbi:hypothetical protein E4U32_003406 [Claviceps aff. humidiphila group G2b]|nr:hypothetical protein E4U32_003406 [Claviceps aff. humidiphila group G2b]
MPLNVSPTSRQFRIVLPPSTSAYRNSTPDGNLRSSVKTLSEPVLGASDQGSSTRSTISEICRVHHCLTLIRAQCTTEFEAYLREKVELDGALPSSMVP